MDVASRPDTPMREAFRKDLSDTDATPIYGIYARSACFIRSADGTIQHWSAGMEQLSDRPRAAAVGCISHSLLQTWYPLPLADIEAAFRRHGEWRGGIVCRRGDGVPLGIVVHWQAGLEGLVPDATVIETYTDVMTTRPGEVTAAILTDLMQGLIHEMSQPLTALDNYVLGVARLLRLGWPDRTRAHHAMTQAITQSARAKETLRLMRGVARLLAATERLETRAPDVAAYRSKAA